MERRGERRKLTWNSPLRKREMGDILGGNEEEVMPNIRGLEREQSGGAGLRYRL